MTIEVPHYYIGIIKSIPQEVPIFLHKIENPIQIDSWIWWLINYKNTYCFFPILNFYCENSIVTSLPLFTKDGLYLSLYNMPVPPPSVSFLGMFLRQYPAFCNLFILSQSSSFTHVSVRKQKSKSLIIEWCNIISSFPLINLGLQIAILTKLLFYSRYLLVLFMMLSKFIPLFMSHCLSILSFASPLVHLNFVLDHTHLFLSTVLCLAASYWNQV